MSASVRDKPSAYDDQTEMPYEAGFSTSQKPGAQRRDEGMARAAENAGDWTEAARYAIERWFEELPLGTEFKGEDIRIDIRRYIGEPHDHHAWSSILGRRCLAWVKDKRAERVGFVPAEAKTTHAHPVRVYRKIQ